MTRNANIADVTDMSPAAFDVYLDSIGGGCPTVEHLTVTERLQLANALGFDAPTYWLYDAPVREVTACRDYEGAILARQEADGWWE